MKFLRCWIHRRQRKSDYLVHAAFIGYAPTVSLGRHMWAAFTADRQHWRCSCADDILAALRGAAFRTDADMVEPPQ